MNFPTLVKNLTEDSTEAQAWNLVYTWDKHVKYSVNETVLTTRVVRRRGLGRILRQMKHSENSDLCQRLHFVLEDLAHAQTIVNTSESMTELLLQQGLMGLWQECFWSAEQTTAHRLCSRPEYMVASLAAAIDTFEETDPRVVAYTEMLQADRSATDECEGFVGDLATLEYVSQHPEEGVERLGTNLECTYAYVACMMLRSSDFAKKVCLAPELASHLEMNVSLYVRPVPDRPSHKVVIGQPAAILMLRGLLPMPAGVYREHILIKLWTRPWLRASIRRWVSLTREPLKSCLPLMQCESEVAHSRRMVSLRQKLLRFHKSAEVPRPIPPGLEGVSWRPGEMKGTLVRGQYLRKRLERACACV